MGERKQLELPQLDTMTYRTPDKTVSTAQASARKVVKKYNTNKNNRLQLQQRKELEALRGALPAFSAVKDASDLNVVLAAIRYIEDLQRHVMASSVSQQSG